MERRSLYELVNHPGRLLYWRQLESAFKEELSGSGIQKCTLVRTIKIDGIFSVKSTYDWLHNKEMERYSICHGL